MCAHQHRCIHILLVHSIVEAQRPCYAVVPRRGSQGAVEAILAHRTFHCLPCWWMWSRAFPCCRHILHTPLEGQVGPKEGPGRRGPFFMPGLALQPSCRTSDQKGDPSFKGVLLCSNASLWGCQSTTGFKETRSHSLALCSTPAYSRQD